MCGPVYVTSVWYAACPPCRAEAPDLEALAQTYQPDGVVFIGVLQGIAIAAALSLADFIRRAWRPYNATYVGGGWRMPQ